MPLYLRRLIKAKKPVKVRPHQRKGKQVTGYVRQGQIAKTVARKRKFRLKATQSEWKDFEQIAKDNMGYLVYMGKVICFAHGITPRFYHSQPTGDLEDLVQEGKFGMYIGGMEWIKTKKTGKEKVPQLVQMKTRAKQKMRLMAKKLRSEVSLPRDVVKDLAIISTARQALLQQKEGGAITSEELAEMITLRRRTREGGFEEYTDEEKLERVEALMTWREAQFQEDFDIHPLVSESDVRFWTRYTYDQRQRREQINKVIERMVSDKEITPEQRDIVYLKFHFDQPDYARRDRTFENITRLFDKASGVKYVRVRSKVGDKYRFTPKGNKTAITARIVRIKKGSFYVARDTGTGKIKRKKEFRIMGKPPMLSIKGVDKTELWRKYTSAIDKLIKQPELKIAWEATKSVWSKLSKSLLLFIPSLQVSHHTEK